MSDIILIIPFLALYSGLYLSLLAGFDDEDWYIGVFFWLILSWRS